MIEIGPGEEFQSRAHDVWWNIASMKKIILNPYF